MAFGCLITAAPRPDEPDVQSRSLASILRAGFERPTIYAEPETSLPKWIAAEFDIRWRPFKYGEWRNWICSVFTHIHESPGLHALVTIQDDILLCRNVAQAVESWLWPSPHCGCLHIYTSARYKGILRHGEIIQIPHRMLRSMSGACCMAFPRQAIIDIVGYAQQNDWRGHTSKHIADPAEKQGLDTFLGLALRDLGYEVWACVPSLGEHISQGSTLGHGGPHGARRAALFVGEDCDALSAISGNFQRFNSVQPKNSRDLQNV